MGPLYQLLKKDVEYNWGKEQQEAFDKAKEKLTEAPVMPQVNPELPITIETDASDYAIGAVLAQPGKDGKLRPTAYYSRRMIQAELNYPIFDKELLAIVTAFKVWTVYLEGAKHKVTVISDHQNLTYFLTTKVLSRRHMRWAEELARFDFKIVHCKGKENVRADALSRKEEYQEGLEPIRQQLLKETKGYLEKNDLTTQAVETHKRDLEILGESETTLCDNGEEPVFSKNLEEELEYNRNRLQVKATKAIGPAEMTINQLQEEIAKDELIQRLLERSEESDGGNDRITTDSDGLVYWYGLLYVPQRLRNDVITKHHDYPMEGHQGVHKTVEKIQRNYYWPQMRRAVERYIRNCEQCLRNQPARHQPYGKMQEMESPTRPFEEITMDFIGPLPRSEDPFYKGMWYDSILVNVDRLTKYIHLEPTRTDSTAEQTAYLVNKSVIANHGVPKRIITDRDTRFNSKFWRSLMDQLGIKHKMSTAYHPQTDGQTERINGVIEQYLRNYVNYQQGDWVTLLPMAQFAYNNGENATTGVSPFYANYGRHPDIIGKPNNKEPEAPRAKTYADVMDAIYIGLK